MVYERMDPKTRDILTEVFGNMGALLFRLDRSVYSGGGRG
jgi:hypothetical protein